MTDAKPVRGAPGYRVRLAVIVAVYAVAAVLACTGAYVAASHAPRWAQGLAVGLILARPLRDLVGWLGRRAAAVATVATRRPPRPGHGVSRDTPSSARRRRGGGGVHR